MNDGVFDPEINEITQRSHTEPALLGPRLQRRALASEFTVEKRGFGDKMEGFHHYTMLST